MKYVGADVLDGPQVVVFAAFGLWHKEKISHHRASPYGRGGTLGVTERGFCWNRWPKPPLTAHGGAPPPGEPYVVGITILHTEIYFAQKRILLGPSGTSAPTGWREF